MYWELFRTVTNNRPFGKEAETEWYYVILEQPAQSLSLQKCTEENLELLTTTEHNITLSNN